MTDILVWLAIKLADAVDAGDIARATYLARHQRVIVACITHAHLN